MRAGHIARGARTHLDALDRLEPADIIVPFGDLLHQRIGDGHRQLRRPAGPRVVRAGDEQQRKEKRRRKEEALDRKSVVSGKSVSVRVDLGGRRLIKHTKTSPTVSYNHNNDSLNYTQNSA